jgi:hypothetical protein
MLYINVSDIALKNTTGSQHFSCDSGKIIASYPSVRGKKLRQRDFFPTRKTLRKLSVVKWMGS